MVLSFILQLDCSAISDNKTTQGNLSCNNEGRGIAVIYNFRIVLTRLWGRNFHHQLWHWKRCHRHRTASVCLTPTTAPPEYYPIIVLTQIMKFNDPLVTPLLVQYMKIIPRRYQSAATDQLTHRRSNHAGGHRQPRPSTSFLHNQQAKQPTAEWNTQM